MNSVPLKMASGDTPSLYLGDDKGWGRLASSASASRDTTQIDSAGESSPVQAPEIFTYYCLYNGTPGGVASFFEELTPMHAATYNRIDAYLTELLQEDFIEEGAVRTVRVALDRLKKRDFWPPTIVPQEPEAIVLGWESPYAACALTITEDEYGYIVLEAQKPIQVIHSQPITTLQRIVFDDE